MTLEQQLTDMIRNHGLLNISITATTNAGKVEFYATAQAEGGDINGRWVGTTSHSANVSDVVTAAIIDLNNQRTPGSAHTLAPIEGLAA